ncbi:MAG TPA: AMP-binding protein, partial [Terriglobia bacterium]|nr:AMP-binding protein [Terriglobia bacterium]
GDGEIIFSDRIGEYVALASGGTLAPQLIEARLRFSPYIRDAWVLAGPQNAYIAVIIVIDYERVGRWAGQRRVPFSNFAELSQVPEVCGLIRQDIERVNMDLPPASRIRKYANLYKEFDADEGELTRTRKLRKSVLQERYRGLISAIYNDDQEVLLDGKVTLKINTVEGAA